MRRNKSIYHFVHSVMGTWILKYLEFREFANILRPTFDGNDETEQEKKKNNNKWLQIIFNKCLVLLSHWNVGKFNGCVAQNRPCRIIRMFASVDVRMLHNYNQFIS